MRRILAALVTLALLLGTVTVHADIFRWDDGTLIPGTEGITPGPGIDLSGWNTDAHNLRFADFSAGLDFSGAGFSFSWLDYAHFQGANLTGAEMTSTLTNANLSGANLTNAYLGYPTTLTNADLRGANLTNAYLVNALVGLANLTGADMRGAQFSDRGGTILHNTILPEGNIAGLDLGLVDTLVVCDDDGVDLPPNIVVWPRPPIPVTVQDHLTMSDVGVLELRFDADPWDSLISFQAGIPVNLGGTLELTFDQPADAEAQVGRALHVFNWSGVSPTGQFTVASLYDWDLSSLYATGEVTLLVADGVIAGDATGDGKVDLGDFGTLKEHFGSAGARPDGDANGDGQINLSDFGLLKANFGKSAAAAVPEPSGFALGLLAGVLWALRRPGRRTRVELGSALSFPTYFDSHRELS